MAQNPVDRHVGEQLRKRRVLLGMSQQRLAETLGLSFQQVQKYEKGANRLGASRLFETARILDVPVSYFFSDMPGHVIQQLPAGPRNRPENNADIENTEDVALLGRRETLEMVSAYYRIKDETIRKRLLAMIRAVGDGSSASRHR